jgi:hypothetical protein
LKTYAILGIETSGGQFNKEGITEITSKMINNKK